MPAVPTAPTPPGAEEQERWETRIGSRFWLWHPSPSSTPGVAAILGGVGDGGVVGIVDVDSVGDVGIVGAARIG